MGLAGPRKLYMTSNGAVTIRATTHIEVRTGSAGVLPVLGPFLGRHAYYFVANFVVVRCCTGPQHYTVNSIVSPYPM